MAEEMQLSDGQIRQAKQQLDQLHYTARERAAEHQQLSNKKAQAQEALQRAERMVEVLKEKVQHAEEIAEWRMRKLERQLDVKKGLREMELTEVERLGARLRDEKQREIEALREKFETQERHIDEEANLGGSRPAWSPPKSWGAPSDGGNDAGTAAAQPAAAAVDVPAAASSTKSRAGGSSATNSARRSVRADGAKFCART